MWMLDAPIALLLVYASISSLAVPDQILNVHKISWEMKQAMLKTSLKYL